MLLRNLHSCMYGNQAAGYFSWAPPTLREYLSQGPRARPLPADSIWSPLYDHNAAVVEVEEDGEEGEMPEE
jgi:hypothetical protein